MTGSLHVKKNNYYVVVNDTNDDGKRIQKWIPTHVSALGHNKREAQRVMNEILANYVPHVKNKKKNDFHGYVEKWLENVRHTIEETSYQGYACAVSVQILPFFDALDKSIEEITPDDVQAFMNHLLKCGNKKTGNGLSAKSVRNYMTVLSQIFDDAVRKRVVTENPVKLVRKPKKERYDASFYTGRQINEFMTALGNDPFRDLILITSLYGLRRSELLGLKWDSINMDNETVTIKHTVCRFNTVIEKDNTKTKSSYRTYPMLPIAKEIFTKAKRDEDNNRRLYGDSYIENDYVFKRENGQPYPPDYLTRHFGILLKRYGMPKIRFHDLRHSCASIMINSGANLKDVQGWLGHSDIQTTGNIYGHLTAGRYDAIGAAMESNILNANKYGDDQTSLSLF